MVADSCFQGWTGVIRTSLNTMSYYCTLLFFDCYIIGASKGTFVVYKSSPWSLPQNQHQWFQEWQWSLAYISLTIILQCLLIKAHILLWGKLASPLQVSEPCIWKSWGQALHFLGLLWKGPSSDKENLKFSWPDVEFEYSIKGKEYVETPLVNGSTIESLIFRPWMPTNISQKCTNRDQLTKVRCWGKGDKSDGENTRTPRSVGKCLRVSYEKCGNLGAIVNID